MDEGLVPVTEQWMSSVDLSVFGGEFSCCHLRNQSTNVCDKESLMPAVLGLYSLVLERESIRSSTHGKLDHSSAIDVMIKKNRDHLFPKSFTFEKLHGGRVTLEERELFGPLIERMEAFMRDPAREEAEAPQEAAAP